MPSLFKDRDFRFLWLGQTASQLGEQATLVVLPLIAVLTLGVAPDQLGALRAVGQAPLLLLPLLAGAWPYVANKAAAIRPGDGDRVPV